MSAGSVCMGYGGRVVVDGGALLLSWAESTRGRAGLRGGGLALDPLRRREMTAAIKMYVGGRCMFFGLLMCRTF